MTETSVLPPEGADEALASVLRAQVVKLAEQVDGFRDELKDLFEQLGVTNAVDAASLIEMMQYDIALARELVHVYTRDPQDSASIVAALLALVEQVS